MIDKGVYIDPFFNYESELKAGYVGFSTVPSFNLIKLDPVITKEFPEGRPTYLKRQWEGFISLPTLAELTGCTYKGE